MANTYYIISKTILSASQTTITFSSIPQTYTDLVLSYSSRTTSTSNGFVNINFNGSTTSFTNSYMTGSGTLASAGTGFNRLAGTSVRANESATTFSNSRIYIPNYTSSINKTYYSSGVAENNATSTNSILTAGLWSNTAAITQIDLVGMGGDFVSGSSFYLYGIKNS